MLLVVQALSGCVNESLLEQLMDESRGYVERDPPKSLGKEVYTHTHKSVGHELWSWCVCVCACACVLGRSLMRCLCG